MNDKTEIIRLCDKTSFNSTDIISLKNLYLKYIDNKALICTSCPGSLRHYIKVFKSMKDRMLFKIDNTITP